MAETHSSSLIYLDHNVLNSMLKGDPVQIKACFDGEEVIAVYSNENLQEISRSTGFERDFLDLLREIKARHLVSFVDGSFVPTGRAQILEVDPHEAYSSMMETLNEAPKGDFGLSALLRKSYGGLPDTSHLEIVSKGNEELIAVLRSACEQLQADQTLDPIVREQVPKLMAPLPAQLTSVAQDLAGILDAASPQMTVRAFEKEIGMGPLEFNNISGPRIVLRIWEKIQKRMVMKARAAYEYLDVGTQVILFPSTKG